MGALLIKNTKICDQQSPCHGMLADVLVDEHGIISQITREIEPALPCTILHADGAHLVPGFFDFRCSSGEPGYETRETFATLAAAASGSGITGLAINPDTNPCIDTKSIAEFIQRQSNRFLQTFYPIGSITKGMQGRELSELFDLNTAGVKAFTDHHHPVQNLNLLLRAMIYASGFGARIMQMPQQIELGGMQGVHEGVVATGLGMPGIPSISEEIAVSAIIRLAEEYKLPVHISGISSEAAVKEIKKAKERGLAITCDVHVMNLFFTDAMLSTFHSVYKVIPPLRTEADRLALLHALGDGTLDVICSDHSPRTTEEKRKEFDLALCGASTLQNAVPAAWTACKSYLSFEDFQLKFSVNPRKILGIEVPRIALGQRAEMALFHPEKTFEVSRENQTSLSASNPFIGKTLFGSCTAVVVGNKHQAVAT